MTKNTREKFWKIRISRGFDKGDYVDYPLHTSKYVFKDKIIELLDLLEITGDDREGVLKGSLEGEE